MVERCSGAILDLHLGGSSIRHTVKDVPENAGCSDTLQRMQTFLGMASL
jgi:predicted deacylase